MKKKQSRKESSARKGVASGTRGSARTGRKHAEGASSGKRDNRARLLAKDAVKAGKEARAKSMSEAPKGSEKSDKELARANGAAKQPSKVKFETVLAREEAVSYFEALIEGLRKGTIQLKQGNDAITLKPGPKVAIEVKAGRKAEKERISFEIEWRTEEAANADLKISAS
jgi:amphi-Trp domain-containing protein